MYFYPKVYFTVISRVAFILIIAGGLFFTSNNLHAQTQLTTVVSERDQAMLQVIQQLQEMIVILQRKLTTIQGQKEGQNLINGNSIAETNEDIKLFAEPSDKSKVLAKQARGKSGEVSAGPRLIDGEVWWRFKFRDGTEGWSPESKLTRMPSTTVSFPYEEDGVQKWSKIRFMGEYDPDGFVAEPGEDGTYIRYKGKVVEPY